ncbi:MAG TPA: hypothetical protein VMC02_05900 [Steroidobacteraceae bacterium]|nr:hypothetical protein [Steroidobacteraceae bacterium]
MITLIGAAAGVAHAAASVSATELSPDLRPVLILEAPLGELMLVHHALPLADRRAESLALKLGHWIAAPIVRRDRVERRAALPLAWQTSEPDRGFSQVLLARLSPVAANWPWRTLIVSSSGPESNSQLQTLRGQDAVVAVVRDELVDLEGQVEFHVMLDLTTVRAIATTHETRVPVPVEYFSAPLTADSRRPRRSLALFGRDGPLDLQVSTAATDLSQFLATTVARVSVPDSLHPRNPTLGELRLHPRCGECRASDPVVYLQPGRAWVRVGKLSGSILALPLQSRRPVRAARSRGP